MDPGSSPELGETEARALLDLARSSLTHGVERGAPLPVDPVRHPPALRADGACFVTLRTQGHDEDAGRWPLRGCIGTLEAHRPLAVDAAENAFAAAVRDPRFAPVTREELAGIVVHLSVLSAPEPLPCRSEADLLAKLRPEVDGLLLREGELRSTFLPSVWEGLPDAGAFLRELRRKAGLAPDHWSPRLRFWRYTVQEIG